MSQKKNTVQLSTTVYQRLDQLVADGEFASTDDAANFLLYQQLKKQQYLPFTGSKTESTYEYSPVLNQDGHKREDISQVPTSEALTVTNSEPKKSASDRLKMLSSSFD